MIEQTRLIGTTVEYRTVTLIGDRVQLYSVGWATMYDKSRVVLTLKKRKKDSQKQERNFYKEICQNFQMW